MEEHRTGFTTDEVKVESGGGRCVAWSSFTMDRDARAFARAFPTLKLLGDSRLQAPPHPIGAEMTPKSGGEKTALAGVAFSAARSGSGKDRVEMLVIEAGGLWALLRALLDERRRRSRAPFIVAFREPDSGQAENIRTLYDAEPAARSPSDSVN